ncbi:MULTISPECIES: DUF6157 family protein [unclassified Imperialibacter]|uniref:DUF6157 family protein n=1 Tax=unclassified Imperialibacter TaxID=2629706 RepID=UPI001259A2F3|nr:MULTISPECIES: DUF6157 family protein [unclassified Imperialibacter]CAD5293178.1 conserved hypothetical protein [Imperialibacter sp. 89]CAD5294269.1 conserved hypothetical protein [Imperialibacter sp. 75]VVT18446.1 conserved hypothetical protein [Imperialibacter sp. EC-SDR9]
MKHTTNYYNTFIEIAEDSPSEQAAVPSLKGEKKSVANMQFDMVYDNPYKYTSDEVLFGVFALRNEFEPSELDEQREHYFSKGQPCFRASPLTKQYGWGVHANAEGKIAIYGAETEEYKKFLADDAIKKVKAMRSKRA